jgi:Family of unknown function (DUF6627)
MDTLRRAATMKTISRILILAMLHLGWLTSYGYAEMVPTESAIRVQDDRQRLLDLLERQEVIEELEKYGISKVEAVARINSLTDEEVTMIAGKLDELPPGGVIEPFLFAAFFMTWLILYPVMAFVCLFKAEPWNECMEWSQRFWENWKSGSSGGGSDSYGGFQYCNSGCESDFKGCMESADGEKNEEQECKDNKITCDTKCSDWAEGFQENDSPSLGESISNIILFQSSQNRRYKTVSCKSRCESQLPDCIRSRGLTNKSESQCENEKQTCSQKCEQAEAKGKLCQNPDTNEYYPCEVQQE